MNENQKILKINYLARKVDVLFSFPSRSHCICSRTYGKTMYCTFGRTEASQDCSIHDITASSTVLNQ